MTFREHSNKSSWGDWRLAREALGLRRLASSSDDPQAEADRLLKGSFTADEAARIDAYLAASTPDISRLAAIEARLDGADDDTKWLAQHLKQAWAQMDKLRDRLDDAGSLMDPDYAASAIGYVRWSREGADA
ncbi:hypothetical protein ACFY1B_42870 [Streptomyces mirabilis]|uniref:hypothetical protein n=1 Tax=Streptomyces mirabilis TaxID=68239 RepID=UPI00369486C1